MSVTPEMLLKFPSFRQLSEDQLMMLLGVGEVKMLKAAQGEKIITRGSNDEFSFFLVKGALKLIARDGQTVIIKADSPSAKQPVTQLKPRQYDVVADSVVSYLKVNSQVLENLSAGNQAQGAGIQVENESGNADVYFQLYHDIKADHIVLPSLADVAMKINKATTHVDKINAVQLENMILADPAIAAKLIKLAYASQADNNSFEIQDIAEVIFRLGLHKVIDVVRVLSVKDVFKPLNQQHNQLIKEIWLESIYVGALASLLAEESGQLNPKKAQVLGLLHNIGAILILDCLGKDKSLVVEVNQMRAIIAELGNNIGAMLLDKWGFTEASVDAVKNSQQWRRSTDAKSLDYCDILILAKLFSYVGTSRVESLPIITELPVYRKLGWQENGVAQGMKLLSRAKQKMQHLVQVFDE